VKDQEEKGVMRGAKAPGRSRGRYWYYRTSLGLLSSTFYRYHG
jgi:hypothetical protein